MSSTFVPAPLVANTGAVSNVVNVLSGLDGQTAGDTVQIGPINAGRVVMGNYRRPTLEIQTAGSFVNNKLVGAFQFVYNDEPEGNSSLTAQSDASGNIIGFGTTFTSTMVTAGGVVVWQDGGTTPLGVFTDTTHIATAPDLTGSVAAHVRQKFKIYYSGAFFDAGTQSVTAGNTNVPSGSTFNNITVTTLTAGGVNLTIPAYVGTQTNSLVQIEAKDGNTGFSIDPVTCNVGVQGGMIISATQGVDTEVLDSKQATVVDIEAKTGFINITGNGTSTFGGVALPYSYNVYNIASNHCFNIPCVVNFTSAATGSWNCTGGSWSNNNTTPGSSGWVMMFNDLTTPQVAIWSLPSIVCPGTYLLSYTCLFDRAAPDSVFNGLQLTATQFFGAMGVDQIIDSFPTTVTPNPPGTTAPGAVTRVNRIVVPTNATGEIVFAFQPIIGTSIGLYGGVSFTRIL